MEACLLRDEASSCTTRSRTAPYSSLPSSSLAAPRPQPLAQANNPKVLPEIKASTFEQHGMFEEARVEGSTLKVTLTRPFEQRAEKLLDKLVKHLRGRMHGQLTQMQAQV